MVSVGLLHRGKGEEPLFALRKEGRHNHSDTSTSGDRLEAKQAVGQPLEKQHCMAERLRSQELASPQLCCSPVHGPVFPPVTN